MAVGHLFDVHPALGGAHEADPLADAVGDRGHIKFLPDVGALFNEQATNPLPAGARLVGDQLHAHDGLGVGAHLIE